MSPTRNNCAEPLPETLRLKLHRTPRTPVILPLFNTGLIYDEYSPVLSDKPVLVCVHDQRLIRISTLLAAPLTCRKTQKDTCAICPQLNCQRICAVHISPDYPVSEFTARLILAALDYVLCA